MTDKPLNIADLSIEKLQALAYQQLVELNRAQNNVKLIEAELQKRNEKFTNGPETDISKPID